MDTYDRTSTLASAPFADRRRPRILVIEDDRHVRTLLRDLLEAWGYAADAVPGGREGLALFDAGAYDVVLTDLAMAAVSGLDVAAEVRNRDPAVAVIMFTAAMRDLDGEGRRLGFSVLRKPLDIEGLRRALHASLTQPRPR
ncbi:MAG TPA: response regulator [Methylomirabilota bacterium]|nr:response regulator [Methylomirabilota bacterium]